MLITVYFAFGTAQPALTAEKPMAATMDSKSLIIHINQKYSVSQKIMQDYHNFLNSFDKQNKKPGQYEKDAEKLLDEILDFYAAQALRPLVIEANRILAEEKYSILANSQSFRIRDVFLSGSDARQLPPVIAAPDNRTNDLHAAFMRPLYFTSLRVDDITPRIKATLDQYFVKFPLISFSQRDKFKPVDREEKQ
jgi:hypothetical protein